MAFERGDRILLATAALAAATFAVWFGVERVRSPLSAHHGGTSAAPTPLAPTAVAPTAEHDVHVTEPAMPQPATPDPPAPVPLDQAPVGPLGWLEELAELKQRGLVLPVKGAERSQLVDNFDEERGEGRRHEAIDILAPRDTPVLAVADGTVAKLFESVPGGHTIYQFDPEQRYCYYYAHLERYARGLKEGDAVRRGEVLGYVGTSGNAPPDTPHLHFAIYRLGPDRRWWEGEPLNPYPVLRGSE